MKEGLQTGQIGHLGLDVQWTEPFNPQDWIAQHPRCSLSFLLIPCYTQQACCIHKMLNKESSALGALRSMLLAKACASLGMPDDYLRGASS